MLGLGLSFTSFSTLVYNGIKSLILYLNGAEGLLLNADHELTVLENTSTSTTKTCVDYLGIIQETLTGEVRLLGGRREDHSDSTNYGWGALGIEWHYTEPDETSLIVPVPVILHEPAYTWLALHNRDLTNGDWAATTMTTAKTATGADAVSNSASTITSTASNATILQTLTLASAERITGAYVKRRTGSGVVEMTQDNGVTWTEIIITTEWSFVEIPAATLANPILGFRIVTSGDSIDVDYVGHQEDNWIGSVLEVTTAIVSTVTDLIRIPLVDGVNWNQNSGMILFRYRPQHSSDTSNNGIFGIVDAIDGIISDSTTSGTIELKDGINTATVATGGWTIDDDLIHAVIFDGSEMVIGSIKNNGTAIWSSTTTYDLAFTIGSYLNWFYSNSYINHLYNTKIYKKLQGGITLEAAKTWVEANAIEDLNINPYLVNSIGTILVDELDNKLIEV